MKGKGLQFQVKIEGKLKKFLK